MSERFFSIVFIVIFFLQLIATVMLFSRIDDLNEQRDMLKERVESSFGQSEEALSIIDEWKEAYRQLQDENSNLNAENDELRYRLSKYE